MRNQATTITNPVENQILNTISWTLNVSPQRLLPYMHFTDDLHLDDIDLLLLIATIENQMGVYLTREQAASIQTIGDVTRYFSVN
ncbi:MAG: phosphopantetheine-binding protein [Bacteroidota bacterium]